MKKRFYEKENKYAENYCAPRICREISGKYKSSFAANFPVNDVYPHAKAEEILTLREYFESMRGKDLITNIELKTNTVNYKGIEAAVNELVVEFEQEEDVIVSSFNH